jgi:hypothetical protein
VFLNLSLVLKQLGMQPMLLQRNRLKLLGKQDTLLLLDQ